MVTMTASPAAISPTEHVTTASAIEHPGPVATAVAASSWGGSVSVRTTSRASDGPEFVTVSSYVMGAPATGVPVAVLTTAMSAWSVTSVLVVELLSAGSGSAVSEATVAVFGTALGARSALTAASTVTTAEPPTGSAPMSQLTGGPNVHVPRVEAAFVAVRPPGSASVTVTTLALDGPLFVTVSV